MQECDFLLEQVRLGRTYEEIYHDFPVISRAHSTYLDRLLAKRTSDTARPLYVVFANGPTGVGKTSFAKAVCRANGWSYFMKDNSPWWSGYNGQNAIIWDEFTPGAATVPIFNSISTGDLPTVPIKGSHVTVNSDALFVLSNYSFQTCFPPPQIAATFERRIDTKCLFLGDANAPNAALSAHFEFYDTTTSPKSLYDTADIEYLASDLTTGITDQMATQVANRFAQRNLGSQIARQEQVLALPSPATLPSQPEKVLPTIESLPISEDKCPDTASQQPKKRGRGRPRKVTPQ